MIIVPIGSCCEITYKLEKLENKNERSPFEWHFSFNFKDILKVFNNISNCEEVSDPLSSLVFSSKQGLNVGIDDTDIYTSHYRDIDKYRVIMERRTRRMIDNIKSNEKIVFIRQITDNGVRTFPTDEEMSKFKEYIYKINPSCKYKVLLVIYSETQNIILPEGVEVLFLKNYEKENKNLWESKIKEIL